MVERRPSCSRTLAAAKRILVSVSAAGLAATLAGCGVLTMQAAVPSPSATTREALPGPSLTTSPDNSKPDPSRGTPHQVQYFAGSTSTWADLRLRRSNGQIDSQAHLSMPLESQSGRPYLTVRLPVGSEAIVEITAPSDTDEVWCAIAVDGELLASTKAQGDLGKSTCRLIVGDSTEPGVPTAPGDPWTPEPFTPDPEADNPSPEDSNEVAA